MKKFFGTGLSKRISTPRFFRLCFACLSMKFCAAAHAQQTATLGWDAEPPGTVSGYYLYYGSASGVYTNKLDVGTNIMATVSNLMAGNNYFFAVSSHDADGLESVLSSEVSLTTTNLMFLQNSISQGNNMAYLQFEDGAAFGDYNVKYFPWLYHYDLGYEYVWETDDGSGGVYFYDANSESFWYTGRTLWPFIYDFTLEAWLYYFPDSKRPGHYMTNPRTFYNFGTGEIITR